MLADFFTKPLQGRMFREIRKVIMGHKLISWLEQIISPIKERVDNNNNKNKRDCRKMQ